MWMPVLKYNRWSHPPAVVTDVWTRLWPFTQPWPALRNRVSDQAKCLVPNVCLCKCVMLFFKWGLKGHQRPEHLQAEAHLLFCEQERECGLVWFFKADRHRSVSSVLRGITQPIYNYSDPAKDNKAKQQHNCEKWKLLDWISWWLRSTDWENVEYPQEGRDIFVTSGRWGGGGGTIVKKW